MPARLTVYPPDSAALVRLLDDDTSYRVGRSGECEIRIEHASVSRFHAEIEGHGNAWRLHDTGSKNGLRVGGHLVLEANFAASTWFSVGDVHCAFEALDDEAAVAHRAAGLSRRSVSRALSAQLQPSLGMSTLMPQTIDVVLQLAGLERGFMLYAGAGERLRVRASRGLRVSDLAHDQFAGSAAAVDRALSSGTSVVCCDTTESPWLGARPSVRLGGIRALICVPLAMPGGATGVIYADSRKPGPPVTELDLELVETIASHAATAIEAARMQDRIADIAAAIDHEEARAPLWDDLRAPAA
jgi:GAF domain-containing protein